MRLTSRPQRRPERSERHQALERAFPSTCNRNCTEGRACDCVPAVAISEPTTRRFPRTLQEAFPCDARSAYAIERTRTWRFVDWLCWAVALALFAAAFTAPHWWSQ